MATVSFAAAGSCLLLVVMAERDIYHLIIVFGFTELPSKGGNSFEYNFIFLLYEKAIIFKRYTGKAT